MTDAIKALVALQNRLTINVRCDIRTRPEDIGTILAAIRDLEGVASGTHVIVPVEPTEAMISAGIVTRHDQQTPEAWNKATANIYRAMLSAVEKKEDQNDI